MIRIAAVILAAGAGKRMGMPKALLSVGAENLTIRQAKNLDRAGFDPVHIVVGCASDRVLPILSSWTNVTVNPSWETGQFSSIQSGLRAAGKDKWVAIMPVDVWGVTRETLNALRSECMPGVDAVVPAFQGKHGHPPILSPEFCSRILTLPAESSRLDHLLNTARLKDVSVDDLAVLHNANRPEDIHWR